jgi:hypothetical protein
VEPMMIVSRGMLTAASVRAPIVMAVASRGLITRSGGLTRAAGAD